MAARKSARITSASHTRRRGTKHLSESDAFDVIIVGAGLAGTTAAFSLAADYRVLLLDSGEIGGGATNVGAGIASPILARKGNPTQYAHEALDALDVLIDEIGIGDSLEDRPLIRPAYDAIQSEYYQRAAREHSDLATWLPPAHAADRFPGVHAPLGALQVTRGRVLNLTSVAVGAAKAAQARGCELRTNCQLTGWSLQSTTAPGRQVLVSVMLDDGIQQDLTCNKLILALGAGYRHFPELTTLNLHPVKGQTLRVKRPSQLDALPNITGPGYIAHDGPDIVLGSTFEHGTFNTTPTQESTDSIIGLVKPIVAQLPDASRMPDLIAQAGTRITVPGTRLPMVGPISDDVWILTGLGAKGLLLAPLLATWMDDFMQSRSEIPKQLRPRYTI